MAGSNSGGLGARPPGVARFLYETTSTGDWVGVVEDSPVSSGGLASQNAGSNLSGLYYRFGGAPINGAFKTALDAAGQSRQASADLAKAYDAHFGAGAFAADTKTLPQDRLTSLLVPLTPGVHPIRRSVHAVLYSVGPRLRGNGVEDEPGYRQIYADGFAAIAGRNSGRNASIENLRLALPSTGVFAGTSDPQELDALRAQAAGLSHSRHEHEHPRHCA
ncbi:MAG: hypothetical protein AB7I38_15645 [Dehalococcoidia bacterium]